MATIFYSMAGEGRGHATRVRAIVEELRNDHEIFLFAPHHAYEMLAEVYGCDPEVHLEQIPGLLGSYRSKKLNYFKTFFQGVPFYLRQFPDLVSRLEELIKIHQPDLAITDFEPALPKAAKRCGVPFISFDHQHYLTVNDLRSLPLGLKPKAWFMAAFIKLFYRGQKETIVSSFFSPPLKRQARNVVQTGVLLRPEVLQSVPKAGSHLLVYLRRFEKPNLLEALRNCGREVRIYGLGTRSSDGRLHFCDIDQFGFIEDLRTCYALVSNAGNQLIGEAYYFKKPVLALPETGNFEQEVNAHFVRASGGGDWLHYDKLTSADLMAFLDRVPQLRGQIDSEAAVGNEEAVRAILAHVPASRPTADFVPEMQIA